MIVSLCAFPTLQETGRMQQQRHHASNIPDFSKVPMLHLIKVLPGAKGF
jgi:hypothetical protein